MDNNLLANVQDIKTAFSDIKSAIENKGGIISDCDSVSEYASVLNNLPVNVFTGTFMVFQKSDIKPDAPIGGS
jgi:hypothetical protein